MSQNKYNFKFNPPQLSSEQINKHKSFDDLMAQFETTPAPKEPAKVLKLRSVRRNVAYIAGIGAAAMIAISAYFTIGVNDIEKQMSERLLAQPYIFPQLEKLEKNYNTFIIEGTQGGTLEYESGSKVIVPANAFVDKNGEPLSGAIEIKFKEYHDFVDFFIAGIPMKYDSAGTNQLVSAGMIDIQAFQNGIPVALDKSKPLDIELASTIDYNPAHTYNIYKLDTTARNWVYEGVDRIEPVLDGDLKAEMDKILTDNEVEGDLTDVNNQIAAIRAEQAKELAKIEQSIPLPKQPVKPEPANSENFVTNFEFTDVAKTDEKISELADKYSSLLWEVSKDQATAFEIASNPDADWKDIKWTKTGNGLSYKITLINGVAGSGKTLILINRALLYCKKYPEKQVLLIIHNKPVTSDIQYRIDEWLVSHLTEFDGKQLQSVTRGGLDLGDMDDAETKEAQEKLEQEFDSVVTRIKTALDGKAKDVKLSQRLTDSPACIVADEHDMSSQMMKLMQSVGQEVPDSLPIFEINAEHDLIKHVADEQDDAQFKQWAEVLFEQAMLAERGSLKDPATFVTRLNKLMLSLTK